MRTSENPTHVLRRTLRAVAAIMVVAAILSSIPADATQERGPGAALASAPGRWQPWRAAQAPSSSGPGTPGSTDWGRPGVATRGGAGSIFRARGRPAVRAWRAGSSVEA